ncbi:MAG: 30S ribosome-binding factor RbfA [Gammaproteobacteria bacterium]|nr:MAG: 30S ribosome-binding factor RbfA [Gammaproteobacteria bacterium]
MPREFPRSRRLEEAIQRILGEALSGTVRDPRLRGVVITDVQVSRDLGVARVFFTLLSGESVTPELGVALQSANGFLRSSLAKELRIRRVPELRFSVDEALTQSRSLEALIDGVTADEEARRSADAASLGESK